MMARMGYERTKGIGKRLQGALEPKGLKRESLGSIPTLGLGADPLPARCEQSDEQKAIVRRRDVRRPLTDFFRESGQQLATKCRAP